MRVKTSPTAIGRCTLADPCEGGAENVGACLWAEAMATLEPLEGGAQLGSAVGGRIAVVGDEVLKVVWAPA